MHTFLPLPLAVCKVIFMCSFDGVPIFNYEGPNYRCGVGTMAHTTAMIVGAMDRTQAAIVLTLYTQRLLEASAMA